MHPAFDLVIFDCDGVLVDSEMLSASVLMDMLLKIGIPMTDEIFRSDFLGRSFASAKKRAEERFGLMLPEDFQLHYRERLLARMEQDLKPMAGVEAMLTAMSAPFCLATGSSPPRLAMSLSVTGLGKWFEGRAFTASEVEHGKPAPDLCHYAARKMGATSNRCLVIEDSEMGMRAARAAGMTVWHFAGGAHVKAGYSLPGDAAGDAVVDNMDALQMRLAELGLCRKGSNGLGAQK